MGLANCAKTDMLHSFCGTSTFIAPEVAKSTGYGTAADWWGLGVLVCQCLTLCTPFEGPSQRATINNILNNRRTMYKPLATLVSDVAEGFIEALLTPDPAERLGGSLRANELRVHPFFWGLEWSRLEKRQITPPHAAECRARAMAMTRRMPFAPVAPLSPPPQPAAAAPPVPKVTLPSSMVPPAAAVMHRSDAAAAASLEADAEASSIGEWPDEIGDLDLANFV